jgi:hypothetical protein
MLLKSESRQLAGFELEQLQNYQTTKNSLHTTLK